MAFVTPPGSRSVVEQDPDSLTITIPSKRSGLQVAFPVFFLFIGGMLLQMSMTMVRPSRYHRADSSDWFMVVFSVVVIGFAVYMALWTFAGREIVSVRPGSLRRRLEMFGLGFDREYDTAHVANLRAANVANTSEQPPLQGYGRLAFDYGSKTVRFAPWVDDPEAAELRELIASRLGASAG